MKVIYSALKKLNKLMTNYLLPNIFYGAITPVKAIWKVIFLKDLSAETSFRKVYRRMPNAVIELAWCCSFIHQVATPFSSVWRHD